ncbi:MAG: DUF4423 domain-containing protein [Pseudobacteriovorax sp.]|nr:DUF4423 domain-containing protein [Pseudobacteriovorax sp.]
MAQALKIDHLREALIVRNGIYFLRLDQHLIQHFKNLPDQILPYLYKSLAYKKKSKQVDYYVVKEDRIKAIWNRIQDHGFHGEPFSIVLATSGRLFPKLKVQVADRQLQRINVLLPAHLEEISQCDPYWLQSLVSLRLRAKGVDIEPELSSVESLLVTAQSQTAAGKIVSLLTRHPHRRLKNKSYRLKYDSVNDEIHLFLYTFNKKTIKQLYKTISEDCLRLIRTQSKKGNSSGFYQYFARKTFQALEDSCHSIISLGLEVPLSVLAAKSVDLSLISESHSAHDVVSALLLSGQETEIRESIIDASDLEGSVLKEADIRLRDRGYLPKSDRKKRDILLCASGYVDMKRQADFVAESCKKAIQKVVIHHKKRDFNTIMVGLNSRELDFYQDLCFHLKSKLSHIILKANPEHLYQLTFQFSPLTLIQGKANYKLSLSNDSFHDSRWCQLLVREMVGLKNSTNDPLWFAKKMVPAIPLHVIKASLKNLTKAGFLKYDHRLGRYFQTSVDLILADPSYVQGSEFHTDVINLALFSESWKANGNGEFFSRIYLIDEDSRFALQKCYDEFLDQILEHAARQSDADLIYQISIQNVPL